MKKNTNLKIKKLVMVAMYIAIFAVLSKFGTIEFSGMKITTQNLPLFVGAITLGSNCGALIGFLGMFINQMIGYGFSPTILFWLLPHTIVGGIVGLIFENKVIKNYNGIRFYICIIGSFMLLTILNTVSIYVDSKINGYYTFEGVFGTFVIRIMVSILSSIIYATILPFIINLTKKIH